MQDQLRATKLWLQKQFKTSGIQLDPRALEQLVQAVQDVPDPEEFVHSLIDEIETVSDERRMTPELLEQVLGALEGRSQPQDPVQVVDAFQVPHIVYDPVRKLFHKSQTQPTLQADAKSKVQLYIDRFHLVQQRLKRNKLFRPSRFSGLGGGAGQSECELTELKAMLGVVGEQRYVMGFLTQPEEGRFAIEDLSARLPVDLSDAEQTLGMFTQNCIVVAEGELQANGVFKVAALGMPPPERRVESLQALQGLDFFGGVVPDERQLLGWEARHAEDRIVLLSDVWLDRPDILDRLHTVFGGFSQLEQPPSLFVLLGSFQSYDATAANTHYARLREHFAALGRLINQYPAIRASSRFVLVPGPGDLGPGSSLPRPGLPKAVAAALLEAVPNTVLASNPCRIRHGGSEIVLCRDALQQKMKGLAILPPPAGDEAPIFEHVCATVLQQSHLCPVPLEFQPVYWEWDHSLYVYPMPDALVLADSAAAGCFQFDSCSCLNPGSLASGTFAAYSPVTREAEVCDVQPTAVAEEDEDEMEVEDGEGLAAVAAVEAVLEAQFEA
ncbi:hypothetical protein D9Q98_005127 [Chlorella vulgaris]|uniref:DNA polymerase epsilon subunit n=1 Tax=Chlorella vulgaris TaxID=3077 RepID=A0A9D4TPV6_CHLVU|nr:hypothetical protein D9Q98_005127 [Chlorella vulgaris]